MTVCDQPMFAADLLALLFVAGSVVCVGIAHRHMRRMRRSAYKLDKALAEERAIVERCQLLDALLTEICVDAFRARNIPVWTAWATVMGDFEVTVTTVREPPDVNRRS